MAAKKKSKTPIVESTGQSDPLRDAVLAARDDEATLQVWADALLERGDPRGELIQLQLQPPSPARDKQVEAHVRKYARTLLGPLASVVMLADHVRFDRGLLAECAIATDSKAKISAVVGHPSWVTVRSMYFRNFSGGSLEPLEETKPHPAVALLLDETLASLEVALGIGLIDVFAPLCASPRPLALRQVRLTEYEDEVPAKMKKAIAATSALPHLRRLGTEGVPPAFLLEAPWATQLHTLDMELAGSMVGDALARIERVAPQVSTVILHPDRVFENGFDRPEWVYTIRKNGQRFATIQVAARDVPGDVKRRAAFLAELPRHLKVIAHPS